ncbi:hypothetical protein BC833DRAFT_395074 [Globomyces pollinis-pini]|nr:hypothetical protein BC833DRAFT_395074 [Globomyces pollinis-pini]
MQMKKDVKKDKFVNSTTKEIVKSKSVPASSIEKDNNRVGFLSNALGMKNIAENFQKGIQDNQYTDLRVQKITRVTEEGARHPVYEIQLAFERASQVMQFIPGDHITILTFNKDKDPENEEGPSTFCTKFTPVNVQNNGFIRILVKVYPEDYVTSMLGKLREDVKENLYALT